MKYIFFILKSYMNINKNKVTKPGKYIFKFI